MLAGRFRDRVVILERISMQTPLGTVEDWAPIATKWARVTQVSVSGQARFQQVHNELVTHSVSFRDEVALSIEDNRLRWRSEIYEVIEPEFDPSDGLRKFTKVTVKKWQGKDSS